MNGYVQTDIVALFLMVWFITSFIHMATACYKADEAREKRLEKRERREYERLNSNEKSH